MTHHDRNMLLSVWYPITIAFSPPIKRSLFPWGNVCILSGGSMGNYTPVRIRDFVFFLCSFVFVPGHFWFCEGLVRVLFQPLQGLREGAETMRSLVKSVVHISSLTHSGGRPFPARAFHRFSMRADLVRNQSCMTESPSKSGTWR